MHTPPLNYVRTSKSICEFIVIYVHAIKSILFVHYVCAHNAHIIICAYNYIVNDLSKQIWCTWIWKKYFHSLRTWRAFIMVVTWWNFHIFSFRGSSLHNFLHIFKHTTNRVLYACYCLLMKFLRWLMRQQCYGNFAPLKFRFWLRARGQYTHIIDMLD